MEKDKNLMKIPLLNNLKTKIHLQIWKPITKIVSRKVKRKRKMKIQIKKMSKMNERYKGVKRL